MQICINGYHMDTVILICESRVVIVTAISFLLLLNSTTVLLVDYFFQMESILVVISLTLGEENFLSL